MQRETIGYVVLCTIVGSILFDIWLQHAKQPIEYVAEVAHAEEIEPKEAQVEVIIQWTPERIEKELVSVAEKYEVSAQLMRDIIKCESNGSTTIQSHHTKHGVREQSFGLVQINLPSHPSVTYDDAINPAFALDFLGKHLAEGNAKMWSCYKMVR